MIQLSILLLNLQVVELEVDYIKPETDSTEPYLEENESNGGNKIIGPIGTKVAITVDRSDQVLVFICTREVLPEIEENE